MLRAGSLVTSGSREPPPRDRVEELADELSRTRQRGLAYVDRQTKRQQPVRSPILDSMLPPGAGSLRSVAITSFLDRRLTDYAEVAPDSADYIRRLYFDPRGRAPGPGGAGHLLRTARQEHNLSEPAFRAQRRGHLEDFATFLATPTGQRRVSVIVLLTLAALLLVVGTILTAVLTV